MYSPVTERFTDPALGLVDTGSDATLVPLRYLLAIGAQETAPGWLVTVTGERQPVALYFVDIFLQQELAPGIRVVADESGDEIILGRDFLNRFPLFLDGPMRQLIVPNAATLRRLRAL
ncbi:MAG: retroviral-like aspartic protease family protein [Caldilineales bacterium]|nr:retroviral-like aspartic protease family protein [Caldilineales bacterium]